MYEFLDYQTRDVMTASPTTVSPDTALAEAERILEAKDWNALPVVSASGELVGMLSELDLLRAFEDEEDATFLPYEQIMRRPVSDVMRRDFQSVTPRTPLSRVLARMLQSGAKSLPVLDADDRLVGIVAQVDVMRGLRRAVAGERAPS